jgi:hypothetical protein
LLNIPVNARGRLPACWCHMWSLRRGVNSRGSVSFLQRRRCLIHIVKHIACNESE